MGKQRHGAAAADATLEGENGFSLISNETLTTLYANLVKCRLLERHVLAGASARSRVEAGREAVIVGVSMDLAPGDTVRSSHDGVVTRFLTGEALASLVGPIQTEAKGEQEIAQRLHMVLGAAVAHKISKSGKVAVVFWNDATSDLWQNALDAARAHGLPIIFVSQVDASRAIPPVRRKSKKTAAIVDELGLPIIAVDGDDVVAVYRVAHESIARARLSRGPTLIECEKVRAEGQGRVANSIKNMETYLHGKGLFKLAMKKEIVEAFRRELDAAITMRRSGSRGDGKKVKAKQR